MTRCALLGSVVVLGLLGGCSKAPLPAGKYEAMMMYTMPKGTELAMDGKVFATINGQPTKFELAEGVALTSAKSLTARFHTSCGTTIEKPLIVEHSSQPFSEDREARERKRTRDPVAINIKVEETPQTLSVWSEGPAKVGETDLKAGVNKLLLDGCDEAGRTVSVGGEKAGVIPVIDTSKHHKDVFVPADASSCYELRPVVYSEGGYAPNFHKATKLAGKSLYRVDYIRYFLRDPPKTVSGLKGDQQFHRQIAKVECGKK